MVKKQSDKNPLSYFRVAAVTAIFTLLFAGGGAYYLGYLDPGRMQDAIRKVGDQSANERKIAYWQAPMNPTEIYDKPGKSARGMDLGPVYEDEMAGSDTS